MNFSVVYLFHRFLFRISDFFHHWYVDGSRFLGHAFVSFFERLDRIFALRVTLKYFFQPLWKDYTFIGRILGFIFRSGRLLAGLVTYTILGALLFVLYLVWLAIPFVTLFFAYRGFVKDI